MISREPTKYTSCDARLASGRLTYIIEQDTSKFTSLTELLWDKITLAPPCYNGLTEYYESERIKRGDTSDKPIQILPLWMIDTISDDCPRIKFLQGSEAVLYGTKRDIFKSTLIKGIQYVIDAGVERIHLAIVEYGNETIDWASFIPEFNNLKEELSKWHDSYLLMIGAIKGFFNLPRRYYISHDVPYRIEDIDVHVFDNMYGKFKL